MIKNGNSFVLLVLLWLSARGLLQLSSRCKVNVDETPKCRSDIFVDKRRRRFASRRLTFSNFFFQVKEADLV